MIHGSGEVGPVFLAVEHLHDPLHVLVGDRVIVRLLFEEAAGVDELGLGVGLVLGQHEDVDRDGGAEKEIGSEGDDSLSLLPTMY